MNIIERHKKRNENVRRWLAGELKRTRTLLVENAEGKVKFMKFTDEQFIEFEKANDEAFANLAYYVHGITNEGIVANRSYDVDDIWVFKAAFETFSRKK